VLIYGALRTFVSLFSIYWTAMIAGMRTRRPEVRATTRDCGLATISLMPVRVA